MDRHNLSSLIGRPIYISLGGGKGNSFLELICVVTLLLFVPLYEFRAPLRVARFKVSLDEYIIINSLCKQSRTDEALLSLLLKAV